MGMGYHILDHTADIGIEVHGSSLSDLFSQAALALIDLLTDRTLLTGATEKNIRIEGADLTDLWINYLREILYLFNGESFLLQGVPRISFDSSPAPAEPNPSSGFAMVGKEANRLAGLSLEAQCLGDIYHSRRHVIKTEIKAVTYHHAEVKQMPDGWRGVFIVDV